MFTGEASACRRWQAVPFKYLLVCQECWDWQAAWAWLRSIVPALPYQLVCQEC